MKNENGVLAVRILLVLLSFLIFQKKFLVVVQWARHLKAVHSSVNMEVKQDDF